MQLYDDPTTVSAPPALPAAGTPGYFTDGVPGGVGRTLVRAWWLNQVAQELVNIVTAAGLTPSRSTNNQVLAAIQELTAVPMASHTVAGKVQLATAAQVLTGTDDSLAATSLGVAGAISSAINALVNGAPIALSHLNQLAQALNDDPTFSSDIYAALGLKAPLAAPVFTQNTGGAYPQSVTPPAGDNSTKVATTQYTDRAVGALFVGNVSSPTGPWWEWNSETGRVDVWGEYVASITAEGELTVNFPINIGTPQTGGATTLNSTGSNSGSAVAQRQALTSTNMTVMINDSQTSGNAYATGFSWWARGYSLTQPPAI